jgi:hypothetical protein
MTNQEKDTVRWYVVGTTSTRQELHIRDLLRQADIESYVPLEYKLQNIRGTKKRCLSPAITGLVFARTSYNTFQAVAERMPGHPFLRRSSYSGGKELLTVSDGAMERFIALTTTFTENITYFKPDEVTLHEGELVEIQIGSQIYKAEIKRISGKRSKQMVVEIPEVTAAVITVTPEVMRLITHKTENKESASSSVHSKRLMVDGARERRKHLHVETDKKVLTTLAQRLLFEVTADHQEDVEHHMARLEVRRLRQRLTDIHAFTAQAEGELALALFLSAVLLDSDVAASAERVRRAIDALKPTSLLRMRLQLYLARLTDDDDTLRDLLQQTHHWNRLRLSARQKAILDDVRLVSLPASQA